METGTAMHQQLEENADVAVRVENNTTEESSNGNQYPNPAAFFRANPELADCFATPQKKWAGVLGGTLLIVGALTASADDILLNPTVMQVISGLLNCTAGVALAAYGFLPTPVPQTTQAQPECSTEVLKTWMGFGR